MGPLQPPMRGLGETNMAKGQKHGNREVRKPKAAKAPKAAVSTSGLAAKSTLDRIVPAKKKG